MSIYIAHRRKNNASNALNVPSTVREETSSVYDENSQFACLAHANCFGTSSMSLVQRQRRCDGEVRRQWRNYGRQWRQSPPGAPGKGAPRADSNVFLFCLITKFCHVLWLPMTLHSIHFAQYAHALPLTIIS